MRWTWKTLYDLKLYTGHFYRHRNRCQICLMFWVCQSITLASPRESYKEPCQLCIQGCLARHFMALSLSPSLRDSSSASITLTPADTPWRHLTQADISLHHHQTDHNPPIIKTFSSQNSYSLISQAVCPAGWFIMTPPDNICAKSLQLSKSDEGLKCENILQTLSPLFKMTIKQNLHDIVKYCSRASSIAYNNYTQLSTFLMTFSCLIPYLLRIVLMVDEKYKSVQLILPLFTIISIKYITMFHVLTYWNLMYNKLYSKVIMYFFPLTSEFRF